MHIILIALKSWSIISLVNLTLYEGITACVQLLRITIINTLLLLLYYLLLL